MQTREATTIRLRAHSARVKQATVSAESVECALKLPRVGSLLVWLGETWDPWRRRLWSGTI